MIRLMIDDLFSSMPWDKFDAVVFDVGNVLLTWTPEEQLNRLIPERPDLHAELTVRIFKSPYWCMRDRGSATVEEVIDAMSATAPDLKPFIRKVMMGWNDLPVIPEGVAALEACKARGMKCYALTNFAAEEFALACEKFGLFSLFDGYVVSGRIHQVKPGREIYAYLIDKYGLNPARTLFIDDSPANIEAALDAGWQGLCFNQPGKLARFFR